MFYVFLRIALLEMIFGAEIPNRWPQCIIHDTQLEQPNNFHNSQKTSRMVNSYTSLPILGCFMAKKNEEYKN